MLLESGLEVSTRILFPAGLGCFIYQPEAGIIKMKGEKKAIKCKVHMVPQREDEPGQCL